MSFNFESRNLINNFINEIENYNISNTEDTERTNKVYKILFEDIKASYTYISLLKEKKR